MKLKKRKRTGRKVWFWMLVLMCLLGLFALVAPAPAQTVAPARVPLVSFDSLPLSQDRIELRMEVEDGSINLRNALSDELLLQGMLEPIWDVSLDCRYLAFLGTNSEGGYAPMVLDTLNSQLWILSYPGQNTSAITMTFVTEGLAVSYQGTDDTGTKWFVALHRYGDWVDTHRWQLPERVYAFSLENDQMYVFTQTRAYALVEFQDFELVQVVMDETITHLAQNIGTPMSVVCQN